jgi:hypothetical protein
VEVRRIESTETLNLLKKVRLLLRCCLDGESEQGELRSS